METDELYRLREQLADKVINGLHVFDPETGTVRRIPEPPETIETLRSIDGELRRREAAL